MAVEVETTGPAIPRLPRREVAAFVAQVFRALRRAVPQASEIGGVSIAFVDDAAMRTLNRKFRAKNKTTDVLTFPADDSYNEPGATTGRPLGDIVISLDQARRQAATERHALAMEIRYLLLHGILHALGYDHETDEGEMNALELKTRAKVGL
jgi:probable rRNA maturation factor